MHRQVFASVFRRNKKAEITETSEEASDAAPDGEALDGDHVAAHGDDATSTASEDEGEHARADNDNTYTNEASDNTEVLACHAPSDAVSAVPQSATEDREVAHISTCSSDVCTSETTAVVLESDAASHAHVYPLSDDLGAHVDVPPAPEQKFGDDEDYNYDVDTGLVAEAGHEAAPGISK